MSQRSSTYVSPNLGPTAPWSEQTSTGIFRPPPSFSLPPTTSSVPHPTLSPNLPPQAAAAPWNTYTNSGTLQGLWDTTNIMRMISQCVHAEMDYFSTQKEGNRVVEKALAREREAHTSAKQTLDSTLAALEKLQTVYQRQERLLELCRKNE